MRQAGAADPLGSIRAAIGHLEPASLRIGGEIVESSAQSARVAGLSPFVALGEYVRIGSPHSPQLAEIVALDKTAVTIKPYAQAPDLRIGTRVWRGGRLRLAPDESWRGRMLDAMGRPIDRGGALRGGAVTRDIDAEPPRAAVRARIATPFATGVRVVDLFTPLCAGQRIGLFAGSGVGKSTLLGMMARSAGFDTVVAALVGERGREVRDFLDEIVCGAPWITVVATADESPMMRRLAPRTATAIAEHFRDLGQSVLLIVDSVTRYAHAAREVALAAGEPPVARGFAPSVFADLPRLLERAGPGEEGSGTITAIYTVLVDGDDHNDPIADTIRGTLDGHIVLDRAIAAQGRYPAVDLLASLSRLSHRAWTVEQRVLLRKLVGMIGRFEETRDLRALGGYQAGLDANLDQAVQIVPKIYEALVQHPQDPPSVDAFQDLADALRGKPAEPAG